jgi:hypothetical protein
LFNETHAVANANEAAANNAPCGLLNLPAEIRDEIWKLIVVSHRPLLAYFRRIRHIDEQKRVKPCYSDSEVDTISSFTFR